MSHDEFIAHGCPVHVGFDRPPVGAIGVRDGRVVAVGTPDSVRAAMGAPVTEHELPGGAVLPGFVDAHQHAFLVAADPSTDVLHGVASDIERLLEVLARRVAAVPDGREWLRFHGYAPLSLAERRSPTAAELDRVSPERPMHVVSRTFHESVVNSAGLDALGITATTPDPSGGRIVRDRRGRATGVLLEASSFAAEIASRSTSDGEAWRERLAAHGRLLLSHGITRIGDAAVPADLAADVVEVLASVGITAHPLLIGSRIDSPALVEGGTAKVLADGGEYCHLCMTKTQLRTLYRSSLRAVVGPESRLARALGTRAGRPRRESDGAWHTGLRYPAEAGLPVLLRDAAAAGSGLAVHAVGNGSVDAVLHALAADPVSAASVPLRVEHAMVLDDELARRLGDSGLPVVAQPGFLHAYGHQLTVVPVPTPLRLIVLRTLIDRGASVALSSDYPAADLSPWRGIATAVLRQDSTGAVVHPEEALTVAQALDGSSRAGARVVGVRDAGTLEPGQVADLQWCDQDPTTAAPEALDSITTRATWSAGRLVHTDGTLALT
jgi:predicted amidohydrolase YtcJ